MWAELSGSASKFAISSHAFWDGVRVWIERPHILNPRLFGVEVKYSWKVKWKKDEASGNMVLDADSVLMLLASTITLTNEELSSHFQAFLQTVPCGNIFEYLKEPEGSDRVVPDLVLQIRDLLPKQPDKYKPVPEVIILDKKNSSVIFTTCVAENSGLCIPFPYRLMCMDGRIELAMPKALVTCEKYMSGPTKWLKDTLLPKVARWSTEIPNTPAMHSLTEVPASRYSANYHRLKAKYGKKLVEMWPECTDPLKYVYEDIGISAYLVTLWEEERKVKKLNTLQSFVDLGCGNGLLVYILTSEGHKGYGIDVRRRHIWDCYGPETKLVEQVLTPSDSVLFPGYDWIIGNHSDELTPWIPVIAARSSYKTRAFVLPCCLYTFDGKYQRVHADKSSYQSYLEFINEVCFTMGFHVKMDKLRIASVRRICFLCMSRCYDSQKESLIDAERTEFIRAHSVHSSQSHSSNVLPKEKSKCAENNESQRTDAVEPTQIEGDVIANQGSKKWATSFLPREKNASVKNCTNLVPEVLNSLISEIMQYLLRSNENFIILVKDEEEVFWNAGGTVILEELAKALSPDSLSKLKHQCGGLQTLLRNHRNIFTIDKGKVSLTLPYVGVPHISVPTKRAKRRKVKKKTNSDFNHTKPCFFYLYHSNGCPFPSGHCSFKH